MNDPARSEAFQLYRSRRYFDSLDGIRALSILAVVWHHSAPETGMPLVHLGFLGVDMFFVLSGFLIVTLLLRERDRRGDVSLRGFYLRRSLRIFPIYYGLLAALAVFCWLKPGGHTAAGFFGDLPYLLTYTTNWIYATSMMGIAWSLAAEEQFYLLWPPIEKWLSRWAWAFLLGIVAVNQVVNFLMVDGRLAGLLSPWRVPPMCQPTFTPICLGVALAHVLHSPRGFGIFTRYLSARWTPVAVLAVLFLDLWYAPADIAGWPRFSMQSLMAVFLGSCVIRERHWLSPVLDHPVMRRIGVVSYGIYLYHLIGLHAGKLILERSHVSFPQQDFFMCLFITWGMAELSYRFYERPFLRLKDALSRRRPENRMPRGVPSHGESADVAVADAARAGAFPVDQPLLNQV
jgi:peptidoglycan/LPS O-acetylase OafA/YrhL